MPACFATLGGEQYYGLRAFNPSKEAISLSFSGGLRLHGYYIFAGFQPPFLPFFPVFTAFFAFFCLDFPVFFA